MTDLTPEKRAELRHYAEVVRSADYETTMLAHYAEMLALLDAADERDRLSDVLSKLLWSLTGGKLSKTSYPVSYMEQEIEEHLAQYCESDAADERDRLAAQVERVRALADKWERLDRSFLAAGTAGMSMPAVDAVRQIRGILRALDGADDGTTP